MSRNTIQAATANIGLLKCPSIRTPPTPRSAGDLIPSNCQPIEVHVAELKQLFNAMDPSPFRQRDLDPDAEEFIVGWAREIPPSVALAVIVHLERPAGLPEYA